MSSHHVIRSRSRRPRLFFATTCAFICLPMTPAIAATKTWDGGGANDLWQTGGNWNGDTAPLANDALVFGGTVRLNPSNDFVAGTAFNGISFPAGAGSFVVSGNAITLTRPIAAAGAGAALANGTISNASVNPQTISAPITLASGNYAISTAAGAGSLNLHGAFARSAGTTVVFSRAGGAINFTGSGLANDATGILGGWAAIGNDWASLDASGNIVPYTGYTDIGTGAITGGAALNYRYTGVDNITAADETVIHTLLASIPAARTLSLAGTMKLGNGGGIYRTAASTTNSVFTVGAVATGLGSLTVDGGGTLNLLDSTNPGNFAATNNNLTINSIIKNDVVNDVTNVVSVNILGYVVLGGANTYTGGTVINQGRVQAGNLTAFGSGPITVYPGGEIFTNLTGTWANAVNISGNGPTEAQGGVTGPGAIRMGQTPTMTGLFTLLGDARISSNTATPAAVATAVPTISGQITGTGNLEFIAFNQADTTIRLSNTGTANDWIGDLRIGSPATARNVTLRLGAASQIPDGSNVVMTTNGTSIAKLDLNGSNETVGSLVDAAAPTNSIVTNGVFVGPPAALVPTNPPAATLTIGSGNANATFNGAIQDLATGGALSLVKIGTGKQILGGTNTYHGSTTISGGALEVRGQLQSPVVSVGAGTTLSGAGIVGVSGAVGASVTVGNGATIAAGNDGIGALTINHPLIIGGSAGDTARLRAGSGAPIVAPAGVTVNSGAGSVTIDIVGAVTSVGSLTLLQYGSGLGGTGFPAFTLGALPPRTTGHLVNNTIDGRIELAVTAAGDFPVWSGALSSEWTTAVLPGSKNWVLDSNAGLTTDFATSDIVLFKDGPGNTTVNINDAPVAPSEVRFANINQDYLIGGSKGIVGTGSLTKNGGGSVTLATDNTYSGATAINAGTVRVGAGGTSGSLGTGAVTNNSALIFNRSNGLTVPNVIGGTGLLTKEGAGVLSLTGANTYTGETHVTAGTVQVSASNSLGVVPGGDVIVSSGAAVDLAGSNPNFGQKEFVVSGIGPAGHGALTNSGVAGGNAQNAFQRVTLQGDATFGGTARFDLRAAQVGGANQAKLDLAGHTLTKVDVNQVSLVAVDVTAGNIVVNGGAFSMETTSSIPANGSDTITFNSGTRALFFQNTTDPSPITRPLVFNGTGSLIANGSALGSFVGSNILLNGDIALTTTTNNLTPGALTLTGNITETGGAHGVTKSGNCVVNLTGTSTYTGPTTITAGTLNVNGSLGATPVSVADATTLGGTGSIAGTVAVSGRLVPGNGIGTFTTGAVTFSSTGVLVAEINSDTLASDVLVVNGGVTLGGTLNVTDLGATVQPLGTKITLVRYSGAVTGAFSNVAHNAILPVGLNFFRVNYNDTDLGQPAITLTVSPSSIYEEWAAEMHLDNSNKGKNQDPDGDGLTNLMEFAFGSDPLHPDTESRVRAGMTTIGIEKVLTLTVPVRTGALFDTGGDMVSRPIDGLIYMIQGSSDLVDLTSMNIEEISPALSDNMPSLPISGKWIYRSFRTPGTPGNPNPKAFIRLKVTEPAP